uniref:Protein BCCIP homolog n=1 Tax=Panagrellus redivivus TaxID=6233 RepID=A0A7E4V012_PANRE
MPPKPSKKTAKKAEPVEEEMEVDEEVVESAEDEEVDDEEDVSSESEDEIMPEADDAMEKMNFDFEAVPLNSNDVDSLVNLLTQIFLRANIDCEAIAKAMIAMSPLGCVYKAAEDNVDEDSEAVVYGVLSAVELGGVEQYQVDIANAILNRARKNTTKEIVKSFEEIFSPIGDKKKNYFLVNERMLHFPAQIAAPAFASLKDDLSEEGYLNNLNKIILISKLRVADAPASTATAPAVPSAPLAPGQKKKKIGKAEKKRLAAAAIAEAEVLFDNPEEELLFKNGGTISPTYFQYNVEGDVERDSKFHRVVKDGVTYRPYRRVTILTKDDFLGYVELLQNAGF